ADLSALAAQAASMHTDGVALDRITAPTLVIAGDKDGLANHPERLADALEGSRLELLDADHLGAVRVARFVPAIVEWLAEA
ncbi:MAG: hypothetical protein Q7T55_21890, partial [Solirubrobacteraceae bacterium]|nr:hypothetical protein [Solirubrobacteraceae bacterium]